MSTLLHGSCLWWELIRGLWLRGQLGLRGRRRHQKGHRPVGLLEVLSSYLLDVFEGDGREFFPQTENAFPASIQHLGMSQSAGQSGIRSESPNESCIQVIQRFLQLSLPHRFRLQLLDLLVQALLDVGARVRGQRDARKEKQGRVFAVGQKGGRGRENLDGNLLLFHQGTVEPGG